MGLLIMLDMQILSMVSPCTLHGRNPELAHLPELALGAHGVRSPHLHAVDGGARVIGGGVVAPHHLVLVELEKTLQV